ncbi:WYL domain-containing protein [Desulfovibrionales bacterium]
MPPKKDQDSTPGVKLLRMFRKLMLDGRRHFQTDLAEEFQCSPQTIIRLAGEIEAVIGAGLESGLDNRRRWYQIKTVSRSRLGLEFEELRYLSVCRDLAGSSLPEQIRERIDETIFNLSVLMSDQGYADRARAQKQHFAFFSKGKIDYTPHFTTIERLLQAIEEQSICFLRYKAVGKTEIREHRFLPHKLISMSGTLYLLGASVTKDFREIRHLVSLAIHRVHDVILTKRILHHDFPDTSLDTFGLPWHEPKSFCIHFKPGKAAEYVLERIWADEQKLELHDDGSVTLHITTRSEPELMAWVRSFGDEVEECKKI